MSDKLCEPQQQQHRSRPVTLPTRLPTTDLPPSPSWCPKVLKDELPDPVGVLASLVSRTVSLGLPRASGHLYTIGQLLANASHDRALSAFLADACANVGGDANVGNSSRRSGDHTSAAGGGGKAFLGFASFLAAHAVSVSCQDDIRSDVIYVAMEVLDCCTTAGVGLWGHGQVRCLRRYDFFFRVYDKYHQCKHVLHK